MSALGVEPRPVPEPVPVPKSVYIGRKVAGHAHKLRLDCGCLPQEGLHSQLLEVEVHLDHDAGVFDGVEGQGKLDRLAGVQFFACEGAVVICPEQP